MILASLLVLLCIIVLIRIGKKYNKTDWDDSVLNILDGINYWLCINYHRQSQDQIRLPESGPALLVSNHISGLDPLLLIAATNRPLRFMIAHEEYERWWLKWLLVRVGCIPVKRDKNPKKALNKSMQALHNDQVLVVFPQGGIVVDDDGKPLKQGAFVLTRLAKVPLYSVRIEGVLGRGFTVLAVFMRSKVKLVQNQQIYQVSDDNLKSTMADIKRFFFQLS